MGRTQSPLAACQARPERAGAHGRDHPSHPRAPWTHGASSALAPPLSRRPPRHATRSAQRDLECRFQRPISDRNGIYCYALTIQDAATRFLLGCRGLLEPTIDASWPVFQRLFRRYGLPERIRTDNGAPFASSALGRLSTLSVWWIRLGIRPELIEPAHPEQNGRHERMHKTLKAETARPPRRTLAAQQRRFDWFRARYNTERPHEALGQRLPASLYDASPRPYPSSLLPIGYPGHYEVRRVSRNGGVRWGSRWVNVSHVLAELDVGFEEIDDGLWEVYFGPVWLGRLHETTCRIVDHLGRAARREGGNHKGMCYQSADNKVSPII